MKLLDANQLLGDCLQAIQPVADRQQIRLQFETADPVFFVELPMDEVLAPVFSLVLRLLYILPEGKTITVAALKKQDAETGDCFLRIEVRIGRLFFNPNLLFKPDNHRFKVAEVGHENSVIYLEWPIEAGKEATESEVLANGKQQLDISNPNNNKILDSGFYHNKVINRFKEFGESTFVQDKLKATKSKGDKEFLENIIHCITQNLNSPNFDSSALERSLGISKSQLFRKIKQLTGYSTANYIRHVRLLKAAELLQTTELPIREVADRTGFKELSYFSSSFKAEFKTSPTAWRKIQKMKQ